MKNIFILLLAVYCNNSFSQNPSVNQTSSATGAVREKGIPDGSPIATKTIGPAGGTIAFEDGRISVTVPQGALEKDETISIEPITSTLPATAGPGAFRLLPEGLHFKKPVTITFAYNDSIVRGSSPEVLHIAYQDDRGVWKAIKALQLDKLNKTVSVQSTHFSDWAVFAQYRLLVDGSASPDIIIIPNQKIVLTVEYTPIKKGNGSQHDDGDDIEPLVYSKVDPDDEVEPLIPGTSRNWKVFGPGVLTETESYQTCTYKGPSHTPGNKPIYFSVDIVDLPGKEYENAKIILFARVLIADNYLEYEIGGEKIKTNLAQAMVNSEGIGINGFDEKAGSSVINLAIGGVKAGRYPYGELKKGTAEIGLIWKGKGYATNYYIKCDSAQPQIVYSKGSITIEAESSTNYLGIVKGSFRGTFYIPNCEGSQEPTAITGRFVVQVHMTETGNNFSENYQDLEKNMDNLLRIAKDLKMDKNIPKNIPKMPSLPKKKGL